MLSRKRDKVQARKAGAEQERATRIDPNCEHGHLIAFDEERQKPGADTSVLNAMMAVMNKYPEVTNSDSHKDVVKACHVGYAAHLLLVREGCRCEGCDELSVLLARDVAQTILCLEGRSFDLSTRNLVRMHDLFVNFSPGIAPAIAWI